MAFGGTAGHPFPLGFFRNPAPAPPPITSPHTFVYISDGDANGVFNFLGTNYGLGSWVNPITEGFLAGFFTNHGGGAEAFAYVDRADTAAPYTTNTAGTYAMFDLGDGNSLAVDTISIRNIGPGNLAARAIRNFKVQGSNDVASNDDAGAGAATWDDIDIRINDTTMSDVIASSWGTYAANQSNTTPYRHVRVLSTGVNANSDNFFNYTEFEFYGTLTFDAVNPISSPATLTYASDGDDNGALFLIGTVFGRFFWANPHVTGLVTAIRSSDPGGDEAISGLVNRATSYLTTDNGSGEWMAIDLGVDRLMVVSDYLIQNGASDGMNAPKNWKLQGSNDVASDDVTGINAATWDDLDTRSANTAIAQSVGSWGHFTLGVTPSSYRWLRILATGVNQAGLNYLQIGELEFYGTLNF